VTADAVAHVSACAVCGEAVAQARAGNAFLALHGGALKEAMGAGAEPYPSVPGYSFIARVESGGQGVVYKALQTTTHRQVAVKMVRDGAFASTRQRFRFERETDLLAALSHPNIVTVFDKGRTAQGQDYLIMEWISGLPLDEYVAKRITRGPGPRHAQVRAMLVLFSKIAHALEHAHGASVIHRDLKPSNILVDDEGEPHLIDFGLARPETGPRGPMPTMTEEFAGTRAYASPEQVAGGPGTMRVTTDVYSLGVMFFHVLTGRFPYPVDGPSSDVDRHVRFSDPPALRSLDREIPPDVETIVLKSLSKDPLRRYQAAGLLACDIDDFLAGRAISARRDSVLYVLRKSAQRHRGAFAALVGLMMLISAFAIAMTVQARHLAHQQRSTAAALALSNIQRGRLMSKGGDESHAESLLWSELLRAGGRPEDPGLMFVSPPEVMCPVWGLVELYSREPRLMSAQTSEGLSALSIDAEAGTVTGTIARGQLPRLDLSESTWSIEGGLLLSNEVLPTPGHDLLALCPLGSDVMAYRDGELAVMARVRSGARLASCNVGRDQFAFAVVSPDCTMLATLDVRGSVVLWDLRGDAPGIPLQPTLPALNEFSWDSQVIFAGMSFSADGRYLGATDQNRAVVWRVASREIAREMRAPPSVVHGAKGDNIRAGCLSPDGQWFAAAVGDYGVVWRTDSNDAPTVIRGHTGTVTRIAFSGDSSQILSTSIDKTIRLWDTRTCAPLHVIGSMGKSGSSNLAVDPSGRLVATADYSLRVGVWETRPRGWLWLSPGVEGAATCVSFSGDGRRLASGDEQGNITVWDTAAHRAARTMKAAHDGAVFSLDWSPDGAMVSLGGDGLLCRWDEDGRKTVLARDRGREWGCARLTPDGAMVAATDNKNSLSLWDARSGASMGRVTDEGVVRFPEVAMSPDGRMMASAAWHGTAALWSLSPLRKAMQFEGSGAAVRTVRFSPDGSEVATGGDDATIRVWSTSSGRLLATFDGVSSGVFSLVWHPAGNLLFSAGRDKNVQVWDRRTGVELASLEGHADSVYSMALSPDGATLATASKDGTVGIWSLAYYQTHIRGNASYWRDTPRP
jgi:WD40 repeat protein/tRNA A-37 threonylcarbamoyl transferase component Bud32